MSQTAQSKHQQRVHVKQYTAYTHNYNNKTYNTICKLLSYINITQAKQHIYTAQIS